MVSEIKTSITTNSSPSSYQPSSASQAVFKGKDKNKPKPKKEKLLPKHDPSTGVFPPILEGYRKPYYFK